MPETLLQFSREIIILPFDKKQVRAIYLEPGKLWSGREQEKKKGKEALMG